MPKKTKKPKPTRGRPITTGTTPIRSIRVGDEEWESFRAKAARDGFFQRGAPDISAWLRSLGNGA